MRMRRTRKFKTNKKFKLFITIVFIFYLVSFSISYLTSETGAYFIDFSEDQFTLQVGKWWDGSELSFIGKNTQNIKKCPITNISVKLKNNGNRMLESTKYEVYFSENGNPQNHGKKIAEGTIELLDANEVIKLTYNAELVGSYMFKAFQVPGYKDNFEEREEIWSEKVMVKCNNKKNDIEIENKEEITEETSIQEEDNKPNEREYKEENNINNQKPEKENNNQTDSIEINEKENVEVNETNEEIKEEQPIEKEKSNDDAVEKQEKKENSIKVESNSTEVFELAPKEVTNSE